MLLALLLSGGPTEAGNALGVGCRAGITERAFTGPTAARVWALAMGGVTGPELREACFAAGLEVGGFLAACDTTEYKFRAGDTVGRWAQVVADQARLRQVSEIARGLSAAPAGLETALRDLEPLVGGAGNCGDLVPAVDLARRFSERLRDQRGAVCSLGLPQADRLVGPLSAGQVTVISARTSVGKSKLLQNVIHYNVATAGVPTHFYSLEQAAEEVMGRLWSVDTGMPVPDNHMAAVGAAVEYDHPLWVCDTPRLSAADIAARVRGSHPRPKLVGVDYLGLMTHPSNKNSTEAWGLGETLKGLRANARTLEHHCMVAAQVNRDGAEGEPDLHHIRGSGDIEQDADRVLILYVHKGNLWLKVAKNRITGRVGKVQLRSLGESCRLEEV